MFKKTEEFHGEWEMGPFLYVPSYEHSTLHIAYINIYVQNKGMAQ